MYYCWLCYLIFSVLLWSLLFTLLLSVSREQLNQFLQTEVLAKYSFLFKQKTDSAAPDGGSLEDWLQSMLGQMQRSIEHHVNSAMDGSSM